MAGSAEGVIDDDRQCHQDDHAHGDREKDEQVSETSDGRAANDGENCRRSGRWMYGVNDLHQQDRSGQGNGNGNDLVLTENLESRHPTERRHDVPSQHIARLREFRPWRTK